MWIFGLIFLFLIYCSYVPPLMALFFVSLLIVFLFVMLNKHVEYNNNEKTKETKQYKQENITVNIWNMDLFD